MIWQITSTSSADTERLGELLGEQLTGREVIELRSDLGGGKTTMVRGITSGAGSSDRVGSPTFTLSKEYKAKKFDIHHFDFYRLSEAGILKEQLVEATQTGVVIVEWADIVKDVLPQDHLSIELKPVAHDPDERQITITYSPSYQPVVAAVQAAWQEVEP
jgi:tRNA threonylcarbamoyladenosine biosynthesis protein TsaE